MITVDHSNTMSPFYGETKVIGQMSDGVQSIATVFDGEFSVKKVDCEIKFIKTHLGAKLPYKAHDNDNCWDLYAVKDTIIPPSSTTDGLVDIGHAVVPVGLSVAHITDGYGFVIKPRSGMGFVNGINPHAGEIDNGYRGDIGVKLYNLTSKPYTVLAGDRIAQIKVERVWDTTMGWADTATESKRGATGFGNSGK